MGGNQDFVAVEFRVGNVVVDVREMRLARQHASVAACVQDEFRGQFIALAGVGFDVQAGKIAAVVERGYAVPETYFNALFGGFFNQDFVEHGAADLVNRAGAV